MEQASAGVKELMALVSQGDDAQYFDEDKFSDVEIRKQLNDTSNSSKLHAMKRILAASAMGRDVSRLFAEVVKNISSSHSELKKLVYMYLVEYAEVNRDLTLLSINSFQRDLVDRNQIIRAAALRSMASIRVIEMVQLVVSAVRKSSVDSSPYVRKTAAQSLFKVYLTDPDQLDLLIQIAVRLMSDVEVCVVGSALSSFTQMCLSAESSDVPSRHTHLTSTFPHSAELTQPPNSHSLTSPSLASASYGTGTDKVTTSLALSAETHRLSELKIKSEKEKDETHRGVEMTTKASDEEGGSCVVTPTTEDVLGERGEGEEVSQVGGRGEGEEVSEVCERGEDGERVMSTEVSEEGHEESEVLGERDGDTVIVQRRDKGNLTTSASSVSSQPPPRTSSPPPQPHTAPIQPPPSPHTAPIQPPPSPHTTPTQPPHSPHTHPSAFVAATSHVLTRRHQPSEQGPTEPKVSLTVLHPLYRKLCRLLLQLDQWSQCAGIDLLVRYCRLYFKDYRNTSDPMPNDLELFLTSCLQLLRSQSGAVVVAASSALFHLAPQTRMMVVVRPLIRVFQTSQDSLQGPLLSSMRSLMTHTPQLWRPYLPHFFIRANDPPDVKVVKSGILLILCDESNAKTVLKELQTYAAWPGNSTLTSASLRGMTEIAQKIEDISDSVLRGLVRTLDCRSPLLSSEAVVALRGLLHQRRTSSSQITAVVAHLAQVLQSTPPPHSPRSPDDSSSAEDGEEPPTQSGQTSNEPPSTQSPHSTQSPAARSAVIWIVGQYHLEVPYEAPDAFRRLVSSFTHESSDAKLQILTMGLKLWAFHLFNSTQPHTADAHQDTAPDNTSTRPVSEDAPQVDTGTGMTKLAEEAVWTGPIKAPSKRRMRPTMEISKKIYPRLNALFDHTLHLGWLDSQIDVRDISRAYMTLKKTVIDHRKGDGANDSSSFGSACEHYLRYRSTFDEYCCEHLVHALTASPEMANAHKQDNSDNYPFHTLANLCQPLNNYVPLPPFALTSSEDCVRDAQVEAVETRTSISAPAIRAPSASAVPKTRTVQDLDSFYSEEAAPCKPAAVAHAKARSVVTSTPTGGGGVVFGEDTESEDEEADIESRQQEPPAEAVNSDSDEDDWKFITK